MSDQAGKYNLMGQARRCRILTYDHLPSTNATAREMATQGAQDGTVIIADEQSAGRGRMQRSFFSPGGTGLYMSVIMRRDLSATDATRLTTMVAVAAAQAIESIIGRAVGIKWVNDIYLDGKKVCGILTEGAIFPGEKRLQYAVVGIGVNITPPVGGFPGEIRHIAGAIWQKLDNAAHMRDRLASEILNRLMAFLEQNDGAACLDEYRRRSIVLGRKITVHHADGTGRIGKAIEIDNDYRLIVRYADGDEETLDSGEVSIKL